jgi:hypothetical protein
MAGIATKKPPKAPASTMPKKLPKLRFSIGLTIDISFEAL